MRTRMFALQAAAVALVLGAAPQALAQTDSTPIYGEELMSVQEREQYRAQTRSLGSEEERQLQRERHRRKMDARARERGEEPPIFGARFMSREEQARYRAQMREMKSEEERSRFREEHRKQMLTRNQEQPKAEEHERVREKQHEEMKVKKHEREFEHPDRPMPPRDRDVRPGGAAGGGVGGSGGKR